VHQEKEELPEPYVFGLKSDKPPETYTVSSAPREKWPQQTPTERLIDQRIAENRDPDNDEETMKIPSRWLRPTKRDAKAATIHESEEVVPFDPLGLESAIPVSSKSRPKFSGKRHRIVVAVDLLQMAPLNGVERIQLDFLSAQAQTTIQNLLVEADPLNHSCKFLRFAFVVVYLTYLSQPKLKSSSLI
jgi:hypothetical protein